MGILDVNELTAGIKRSNLNMEHPSSMDIRASAELMSLNAFLFCFDWMKAW